jgi:two-component system sensor kinase FixL
LFVSQAVRDELGEMAETIIGTTPQESDYPEETVNDFLRVQQLMIETGKPQQSEATVPTVRGPRLFEYILTPIFDDAQQPTGCVCTAYDITDRDRAQAALRESEVRYRQLAEFATDMISSHDHEGRFTFVSPACCNLLGYEPQELIGKLPRVIAHPDDRERVISSLSEIKTTDAVVSRTYKALRKDGGEVWLESVSRNTGREIVVVTRDISSRQAAEQRLRLIQAAVDQVADAVVITEPDLEPPGPRIIYINPAFTRMSGYRPEEVIGKSPRILQGEQTDRRLLEKLKRDLQSRQYFRGMTTNYRKDGSKYEVEWHVAPLRDEQGQLVNWVSIQRDVSEQVKADALARQHREEMAHVTRLSTMGEMASGIAHELNQPLAAISNYVRGCQRFLSRGEEPHDLEKTLGIIGAQADRAGEIIKHMRAFVTKRPTRRDRLDINQVVQHACSLLEADAREKHVQLDLQLEESLPAFVGDAIQIEQVLINLCRNAMEAMDQVKGNKRVQLTTTRAAHDRMIVTIRDFGRGISEYERSKIFDPFFSSSESGMGMGLTISQSIIEAHRGELWVEPVIGRGCLFKFSLPVAKGEIES